MKIKGQIPIQAFDKGGRRHPEEIGGPVRLCDGIRGAAMGGNIVLKVVFRGVLDISEEEHVLQEVGEALEVGWVVGAP